MKAVYAIREGTLRMISEAAVQTYPNEFLAALKAEEGIITEVIVLPGTIQGDSHSVMYTHMLPTDYSVVGPLEAYDDVTVPLENIERPLGIDEHVVVISDERRPLLILHSEFDHAEGLDVQ